MPVKHLTLNNGIQMPQIGLGLYQNCTAETPELVCAAIERGYRLFDTAAFYKNESLLGQGVKLASVNRSELFITSKLWIENYGYQSAMAAFEESLEKLQMPYVDLYLLHWPLPSAFDKTIAAYRALEELHRRGQIRALGVSNFTQSHLDNLLKSTDIIPSINQIELHPYFNQATMRQKHDELGIVTQSWSPLGGVCSRSNAPRTLFSDLAIAAIAHRHRKTAAQIVLRWHLQLGCAVVPKSMRPQRMSENINIFDFELSSDEIQILSNLDTQQRAGSDPSLFGA